MNVTNEILVIRDEMSQFTEEQHEKSQAMKKELIDQIDLLKRKMIVQQTTNNNNQEGFFKRTRNTMNTSISSTTTEKVETKGEVAALRKDIDAIKDELKRHEGLTNLSDKLAFLEEKVQN